MRHNQEGFTLIELLVSIVAATLVTFAAVSLLLLGTRIHHGSTTDVKEQQTVRVVLTLLEEMATSGKIDKIQPTLDGWQLMGKNAEQQEVVLFEYVSGENTVYQGEAAGNVPLLAGLNNAEVYMEGNEQKLMRLSFDTGRGESYTTRIYCRTQIVEQADEDVGQVMEDVVAEIQAELENLEELALPAINRLLFLEKLASQYANGNNTGKIIYTGEETGPKYYSQWYIGSGWGDKGWNKDTPWCACFVSWAASTSGVLTDNSFKFADVDTGMDVFVDNDLWIPGSAIPNPGDYVFFDWSGERKDPAHVGVVLDVDTQNGDVYTIEGNSSGRVAVRKYALNDKAIMGYGVLPQFVGNGAGT